MNRLVLAVLLIAFGASTASSQPYRSRDRYDDDRPRGGERCSYEKRAAQTHYYNALRNQGRKGYLDAGEQRVQQQLQARYDACRAGYGRRRY